MPVTPRLILRPSLECDVEPLHAILGNGRVMRHARRDATPRETAARIAASEARRAAEGFAAWTAILRGGFEIAGWGGVYIDPAAPDTGPEIGVFLARQHWGEGLADEIVAAAVREADHAGLGKLTAFVRHKDEATITALERAGFARAAQEGGAERARFERMRPTGALPALLLSDPEPALARAPAQQSEPEHAIADEAEETGELPDPEASPAADEISAQPDEAAADKSAAPNATAPDGDDPAPSSETAEPATGHAPDATPARDTPKDQP